MFNKESAHLNVVAIIQARMGSRRFPGKVLADLRGRPVLEWVVDAVKRVEGLHQIVVATTTNPEDQEIENWCVRKGIQCFRGEPLDVLKRYADCARKYRATHVLRITADCPLLHSDTVSTVLRSGLEENADYFGLSGEFPDGFDCEGFGVDVLNRANDEATLMSDREHVTPYFKRNPHSVSTHEVFLFEGFSDVRLTVDEPVDLEFLSIVLSRFGGAKEVPEVYDLLEGIRSLGEEEILNFGIVRNAGYLRSLSQEL